MPLPNYSTTTGNISILWNVPAKQELPSLSYRASPFKKLSQLSMIPKTFKVDLPEELTKEVLKCKNDAEAQQVGIEWCVQQCKELMKHHIPSIHFYSIGAVNSIKEVARQIY